MNELTINLVPASRTPLYEQIYSYIKSDIQNGRIPCGEKLPSTRALSAHLDVSRSTVELAYEQLMSEGYIESEPYRGFFVAQIDGLYQLGKMKSQAKSPQMESENYRYDFTPNGVDLKSFPYNVWRKLSRDVLVDDRIELFRAGDPQGEYGFRSAICSYLHQARGVNCTPRQIIVGAGNDYILMLLSTVIGPGPVIAFEEPSYRHAYHVFESLNYTVKPVPMDKNGIELSALEASGAKIAYVTPSHQYPTGIIMPMRRRIELLRWANERAGRYIIEDDYDSEFRYKGKPIPALQGHDIQEKVVYLGTFSKSIAPAIRMSYMVLPQPLLEIYNKRCRFFHSTVSKVDQLIVQKFIEEGYFERHLNKIRALYKSRHDTLIESLKPLADIMKISGEHAGVHLLLTFTNGMKEGELIERAKEKDIRVYGLSDYLIGDGEKETSTILLGYANLSEQQIKEAVRLLAGCWNLRSI